MQAGTKQTASVRLRHDYQVIAAIVDSMWRDMYLGYQQIPEEFLLLQDQHHSQEKL